MLAAIVVSVLRGPEEEEDVYLALFVFVFFYSVILYIYTASDGGKAGAIFNFEICERQC